MLLVNDLCRQAIEKRSLTLQTDGLQHRDFIPLTYICRVMGKFCSINSIDELKKNITSPSVFNVGGGNSQSILAMAKLIQSRVRSTLDYSVMLATQLSQDKKSEFYFHYLSENMKEVTDMEPDESSREIDDLLLFCKKNF
jgi:UDP-glucose 4-epimerase